MLESGRCPPRHQARHHGIVEDGGEFDADQAIEKARITGSEMGEPGTANQSTHRLTI